MAVDPVLVIDVVAVRALVTFLLVLLLCELGRCLVLTTYARTAFTRGNAITENLE